MTEFGANITSGSARSLPSIFELLAQENLKQSIRPALEHAVRIIAQKQPERFSALYRRVDEVFCLLNFILDNYYLSNYDASFAENFYGMRRVDSSNSREGLTRRAINKSILFLVLIPYLKHRCEKYYELNKEKEQFGVNSGEHNVPSLLQKLIMVFQRCYPMMHFVWEGSILVYHFLYMINKSEYHSPYIQLAGVKLHNLTHYDMIRHDTVQVKQDLSNQSVLQKVAALLTQSLHYVAVTLSTSLSVGVFFLQFLEWWYTSDTKTASLTALPTPLSPQKQENENLPKIHNVCPICNKIRTNHTILTVTGYVFCYVCIHRHLNQHKSCPVTGYPVNTTHLVRLYMPD